jgi:hypothetical protein
VGAKVSGQAQGERTGTVFSTSPPWGEDGRRPGEGGAKVSGQAQGERTGTVFSTSPPWGEDGRRPGEGGANVGHTSRACVPTPPGPPFTRGGNGGGIAVFGDPPLARIRRHTPHPARI